LSTDVVKCVRFRWHRADKYSEGGEH